MGFAPSVTAQPVTDFSTEATTSPQARTAQVDGTAFDVAEFGPFTDIVVERGLMLNDWSYLRVNDTVTVTTNETTFSKFTYTLTGDVYDHVNYVEITANGTELDYEVTEDNTTGLVTFEVGIPEVLADGEPHSFTVFLGAQDLISRKAETLGAAGLPFRFEGVNFYPWFDFPITDLSVKAGIRSVSSGSNDYNMETALPQEGDIQGTFEKGTGIEGEEAYGNYTITGLPDFNYNTLTTYGYNMAALDDREFIPAYRAELEDELTQPVRFDYYTQNPPIEYTNVKSRIEVDLFGTTHYTEQITVKHMGVEGQNLGGPSETLTYRLFVNSPGIKSASAYDDFTNLSKTTLSPWVQGGNDYAANLSIIKVSPRYAVAAQTSYTFEVQYEIRNMYRLSETGGFFSPSWSLNTSMLSMFNWTVRDLQVDVVFPYWSSIKMPDTLWGQPVSKDNLVYTGGFLGMQKPTIRMQFTNVSTYQNTMEVIEFSQPPVIGPFWEAFLFTIFFLLVGLVLILLRSASLSVGQAVTTERREEHIPFDKIREFVRHYEEKTALRKRLEELKKRKKNMKKVEFDKQRQTLENKQIEVDQQLVKTMTSLSEEGARYRDAIQNLELAEQERELALSNLRDLEQKKKQKRIRPEVYNRSRETHSKALRRANSRIERVLVELRSLLTERR